MIRKIVILLFVLSFTIIGKAQDFQLGKVTVEELQEKRHPKDTSAVAAVLFKKGRMELMLSQKHGFMLNTIVKMKLKVYKKEGYQWGVEKIKLYATEKVKEEISFIKASTYNLVNGVVVESKMDDKATFDNRINKFWNQKNIVFPNVKEGSVIEYEYSIKTPFYKRPRDWNFQMEIPVNYSEYKTIIPEFYIYNTITKGFFSPKIDLKLKEKKATLEISSLLRIEEYKEKHTTYILQNLPALRNEIYVNNVNDYCSSLIQQMASSDFKIGDEKKEAEQWNKVLQSIYDLEFAKELSQSAFFEQDIKPLIVSLSTPEEKMMAILSYVKNNIKWNGNLGYEAENGIKKAFKIKSGNIGDINILLTSMLKYAGLDANLVLSSTRENGIAAFPVTSAFDYVISSVKTPDKIFLLDASEYNSMPNILPLRVINWYGYLIVNKGNSQKINLVKSESSYKFTSMNFEIAPDGVVKGKLKQQQNNHNAMLYRDYVANENLESYIEKLEIESGKIEIKDYQRENVDELQKPIVEYFSFSGNSLCEVIHNKIYFSPMLFFALNENPFKQETREYPIEYDFPFENKYQINVRIPEGYSIVSVPNPIEISIIEDIAKFKFLTKVIDNEIQISVVHQIRESVIKAQNYDLLKEYYQRIIEKQNEKIVLKKV